MLDYLFQLTDIDLFALLCVVFIFMSIVAVLIIRRFVPKKVQYQDNSVIGNIAALIGVIYGVLVGLTALYLFNNNSYTADAVQKEANSVADLYRDSGWLKEPTGTQIKNNIKSYITQVVTVEWPLMNQGKIVTKDGVKIIDDISNELRIYPIVTNSDMLIVRDTLEVVKSLYDSREQRIHMSYSELNPEIWLVILIGTILTVGINFLFGMNLYFHVITVSAVSLMASSMIFLLMTLDRPFQGEFVIEPSALIAVGNLINKVPQTENKQIPPVYGF